MAKKCKLSSEPSVSLHSHIRTLITDQRDKCSHHEKMWNAERIPQMWHTQNEQMLLEIGTNRPEESGGRSAVSLKHSKVREAWVLLSFKTFSKPQQWWISRHGKTFFICNPKGILGLPWWLSSKESTCQCRKHWVGKIPWRREWQPTPVFLPGESHGQRSLASYGPWGGRQLDTT